MTNGLPEGAEDVPGDLAAQVYAQSASAGLIISEATQISAQGKGYPGTPGVYCDAQVAGWQKVTKAVHAEGLPVAPSTRSKPRRFETGASLTPYDRATFYGGGAKGYVDYASLD